jgi:hypothetical protein
MMRRFICLGVAISSLVFGPVGCDTHRCFLRSKDDADEVAKKRDQDDATKVGAVESDPSKIMSVDSDSKDPKPFFNSGRRSGGWSSEAREIEKNLGVQ